MYEEKQEKVINISKKNKEEVKDAGKQIVNVKNSELDYKNNYNEPKPLTNFGIVVSNVVSKWTDDKTENTLENINLTVRPGQLVAIIGSVGAGKVNQIHCKMILVQVHKIVLF